MKLVCVFLIAILVAFATCQEEPIDWYDCAKSADGNYQHPLDCFRYILCAKGDAYDKSCDTCSVHPVRCPDGHLIYNVTTKTCTTADQTVCDSSAGDISGGDTRMGAFQNCLDSKRRPKEGDSCKAADCKGVRLGYCQKYLKCDESGKWTWQECGEDLVWNPSSPNPNRAVQAGQCSTWDSLTPQEELQYRTDPDCLGAFWKAVGECGREYDYQAAYGFHRNVHRMSCSEGLIFSQKKETCQWCQDVKREDGGNCCSQIALEENAPRAAQEEVNPAAPGEVIPEEVITAAPEENAPRAAQEEVNTAAPDEVIPDESLTAAPEENAPRAAQEETDTAAPAEVIPDEVVNAAPDENAPRAAQEETDVAAAVEIMNAAPDENAPRAAQEETVTADPDENVPQDGGQEEIPEDATS